MKLKDEPWMWQILLLLIAIIICYINHKFFEDDK